MRRAPRRCSVVAFGEIGLEEVERRTRARIGRGLGNCFVFCVGIRLKLVEHAVVDFLRDLALDQGRVDDVFSDTTTPWVRVACTQAEHGDDSDTGNSQATGGRSMAGLALRVHRDGRLLARCGDAAPP